MLVVFILATIILISCNNNDDSKVDCNDIACTEVFVTLIVSIKDENKNPIALDAFEVINTENGNNITVSLSASELEMAQQSGEYPLVNDASLGINQKEKIQFKGFINNQEVISSNYTVSTDCCHINLVSGTLELSL